MSSHGLHGPACFCRLLLFCALAEASRRQGALQRRRGRKAQPWRASLLASTVIVNGMKVASPAPFTK